MNPNGEPTAGDPAEARGQPGIGVDRRRPTERTRHDREVEEAASGRVPREKEKRDRKSGFRGPSCLAPVLGDR